MIFEAQKPLIHVPYVLHTAFKRTNVQNGGNKKIWINRNVESSLDVRIFFYWILMEPNCWLCALNDLENSALFGWLCVCAIYAKEIWMCSSNKSRVKTSKRSTFHLNLSGLENTNKSTKSKRMRMRFVLTKCPKKSDIINSTQQEREKKKQNPHCAIMCVLMLISF